MKNIGTGAVCAALGLALMLGLSACGGSVNLSPNTQPEITVSASGTVRITPDKAIVTFGVTSQEATAEEAQSKNSELVSRVTPVLVDRGVEEKSIQTTNYSIYPQYDYYGDKEPQITGYVAQTTLSVQDQDIAAVGSLLTACVEAGINRVESVRFLCSGYDEAYQDALTQAVSAARQKAEVLAAAAGKSLGEAVVVTEGWQDTSARYGRDAVSNASFDMEMAKDESVSLQPGETEITANVTVTFRMK